MLRVLEGIFARGNEVKWLLAALGVVLVALGSLLGCSWPFLFVLGAVLGDLGHLLGRFFPLLGCLGVVFGASSGGLERISEAFGKTLEDVGTPQRGKKGAQEQFEQENLDFR